MFQQFLAWWFFTVRGWKTEGNFPYALKQSVIIAGPHTHSVDFFLGLAVRKKMHFEFVRFFGKKELFNPITGWFLRLLGGLPVDRMNTFILQFPQKAQEQRSLNLEQVFTISLKTQGCPF